MFTDEEIDAIGIALEEGGLSHSDIDAYFEHAGVKGMKWGQRKAGNGSKDKDKPKTGSTKKTTSFGAARTVKLLALVGVLAYNRRDVLIRNAQGAARVAAIIARNRNVKAAATFVTSTHTPIRALAA